MLIDFGTYSYKDHVEEKAEESVEKLDPTKGHSKKVHPHTIALFNLLLYFCSVQSSCQDW